MLGKCTLKGPFAGVFNQILDYLTFNVTSIDRRSAFEYESSVGRTLTFLGSVFHEKHVSEVGFE